MAANKSTCKCPSPPGGTVTCEPDQLAICRIENGQIEAVCVDPPSSVQYILNFTNYLNWALIQITGAQRSPSTTVDPDEMALLRKGFQEDYWGNVIVTFRFPRSLIKRFPQMSNWQSLKQP